jgi:Flp pilus assembly protein TadD
MKNQRRILQLNSIGLMTVTVASSIATSAVLIGCATGTTSGTNKVAAQPSEPSVSANSTSVASSVSSGASSNETGVTAAGSPVATSATLSPDSKVSTANRYQPLSQALRSGQSAAFLEEVGKRLAVDQNDVTVLNSLALYHYRKGHPLAAKLLIRRALEKNQPNAALYNNLGVILLEEDEQAAAIANFRKALNLDENDAAALGNLGMIFLKGGDTIKAMPLLEKAYTLSPSSSAIAAAYGATLANRGQYEQARKVLEEVVVKNRSDVSALINLAAIDIEHLNRPKDGMDLISRLRFLDTERKDVRLRMNALEKKARAELQ